MSVVCLNKPEESSEIIEQDTSLAATPTRTIDDCKYDSRFDTLAKRLIFFQRKGETNRQFALRLGVSLKTLEGWLYGGRLPLNHTAQRLAGVLDVSPLWLWLGMGHHVSFAPSGLRLTAIPKTPYFIADYPNGPTEHSSYFKKDPEGGAS